MVSIGPYSESHNFTHMYNLGDLRSHNISKHYCPNSIMGVINNNFEFSNYNHMITLSNLDGILDDPQANFTIFIATDESLKYLGDSFFKNMDLSLARHIIKGSMIESRIPYDILNYSPICYFNTKDGINKLFITNISDKTYINDYINMVDRDIICSNGIIHIIDKLIWPLII